MSQDVHCLERSFKPLGAPGPSTSLVRADIIECLFGIAYQAFCAPKFVLSPPDGSLIFLLAIVERLTQAIERWRSKATEQLGFYGTINGARQRTLATTL